MLQLAGRWAASCSAACTCVEATPPKPLPTLLQAGDETFVLIDYEHSGVAFVPAPFEALRHWPDECQATGAAYTPAADVYSVGQLVIHSGLALDAEALAFGAQLTAAATARPSAAAALQLSWLAVL